MSEIRDVAPGLWVWSIEYPDWRPDVGWGPKVWSTCVESAGEVAVLDAMEPQSDEVWERLDRNPPTVAVVLKPHHVPAVDLVVERYGARAYGPWLFWPQNIPTTPLEPVQPGTDLPGGLVALYDGRGRMETPLWLPEQRALVFADALTAPEGELLVGETPWHEERVLPALRALLGLPFEHVVVSHSNDAPVHDRTAFEQALERPPYSF